MFNYAISFICGIAAFRCFHFFPVTITVFFSVLAAVLFFRHKGRCRAMALIGTFFAGVFCIFMHHEAVPVYTFPEKEISIEGDIIDVPELSTGRIRFTLDRIVAGRDRVKGKIRLFMPCDGRMEKTVLSAAGARVRASARLKEPAVFQNPGVHAYDPGRDGVIAAGTVREVDIVSRGRTLTTWVLSQRLFIGNIINSCLSAESAAVHRAIIPGLTAGIDQEMRDAFSSTGLAHVLSISGTHFGLLAFLLFQTVRIAVKYLPRYFLAKLSLYVTPTQIAAAVSLPVLIIYALISGMGTPAVRSLVMVTVYMLALVLGRKGQWLNSLSLASIIILLWQPQALFDLSFQLSFLAVLCIGCASGISREEHTGHEGMGRNMRIHRSVAGLRSMATVTAAAVLGTTPLVAAAFKQFSLISPVTNLIITPLVCFVVLPLGFITTIASAIFGISFAPLNGMTDTVTVFTLKAIKYFSGLRCADIRVPMPAFAETALYFPALAIALKVKRPWRALPLIAVVAVYIVRSSLPGEGLTVTFLDIGQGDASVMELPDGKIILIDGGTREPDAGRRVIAPFLWARGIRRIDYAVLSHPHPDHYGGLSYVLNHFSIGEIWLNGRLTEGAESFSQEIQDNSVPVRVLRRGDVLESREYGIYVLHPYDEFSTGLTRGAFSGENSASLVLKVISGNVSILFTGDIEREAEESLLPLGQWLKSDIIKMPHHGGRTSSSDDFLKAVNAEVAVVSAGKNNSFGHPHQETIDRYEREGAKIYRTDIDGAVMVTIRRPAGEDSETVKILQPHGDVGEMDGLRYSVRTYLDTEFRRVTAWRDEVRNLRLLFLPF